MSKFVMECPVCHQYVEAKTGFFANKRIPCACGNTINVKTDRMTSKECPSCGNTVVYDQTKGKDALCPVCHAILVTQESLNVMLSFRCRTCGCHLQAARSAKLIRCPVCDSEQDVQAEIKLAKERETGIPSVISYEGDNQTLIWKHPVTDFVTGTQLIVHESQEAVFFRNGEALDSFSPGRYTLETGVLPKMEKILLLPIQGQPFHAEVYFINLTTQMGIKWGTNSKVGLFDPVSGIHVELGASGSFNLRVIEPRRLLIKVVGTAAGLRQEEVFSASGTGYFRTLVMTKVKAHLAKIIKGQHISVLELDEHIDDISEGLKQAINPDLAEYGLEMPEFYVSNILTPEDDPNFRRMKQQYADQYLKVREEEIRKAEAKAAFERKAVEAQTAARMKVIGAQGEADVTRIKAQAEAEAYQMQAQAEAAEMKMKGYTYQQETARQVGIEAMRNAGSGSLGAVSGIAGEMMQLGVGLGAASSVIGMTKDAITPMAGQMIQQMSAPVVPAASVTLEGWTCPTCGKTGIGSAFCPDCGGKKPAVKQEQESWTCPSCGKGSISSMFCPDCGFKKPTTEQRPQGWTCPACGRTEILSLFCPDCGKKKED